MNSVHAVGFAPVWNGESRVLILGSFPSVKSRQEGFYYGNRQNRFWKVVCGYFGEEVPACIAQKRDFLLRRGIALWDVVTECDIVGSADVSIRNAVVADVPALLAKSGVKEIWCNGGKAHELLVKAYPQLAECTKKLPSTSPANVSFSQEAWRAALDGVR